MIHPSVFHTALWIALAGVAHVSPIHAEVTAEQRAKAAGRTLVGRAAPKLVLSSIDGQTIDLGEFYGKKAVYLKFWATWCVPCRQQMPHFQHVYETAGADLAVIAINVGFNDSIEAIRAYRKQLGISMPIVFDDGTLASAFHLRVTPTHIVIGRDGRIQYVGHLADAALDASLSAARIPESRDGARSAEQKADDPPPVNVGDRLPAGTLRTLDGRRFAFRQGAHPRRLTALAFISPWCESYLAATRPSTSANCRNARMQIGELAADPRVRWLGIASGLWADEDDLKAYRTESKVRIPLTLDSSGKIFRTFRVNEVPTIVVADADGRVLRRIDAGTTADAAALRAAITRDDP